MATEVEVVEVVMMTVAMTMTTGNASDGGDVTKYLRTQL